MLHKHDVRIGVSHAIPLLFHTFWFTAQEWFRKYGVDIPPRLDEIKKETKLLDYAKESLQLAEKSETAGTLAGQNKKIIDMEDF